MPRSELEELNYRVATNFYHEVLLPFDYTHAHKYLSESYKQHDAMAEDGPEGLRKFLEQARIDYPDSVTTIKRAFVDDDYVIFHVHVMLEPGTRGFAVVDIFRMENGKIMEHWDVIQPVPETSLNTNTMF
jgi:predicted SnoaL-like aldol condensation-catalyzing enzyme